MKKKVLFLLIGFLLSPSTINSLIAQEKVNIFVNERVELLLTIYGLTPSAEKSMKQTKKNRDWVDAMIQPLLAPYQLHKNHAAVKAATKLYEKYYFWAADIVGNIATQTANIPIDPQVYLPADQSIYAKEVRAFIELANQFYVDTNFKSTFQENEPIYEAIIREVEAHLPNKDFFPMMENYYQQSFYTYNLCPSPLLPAGNGMGFGPKRVTKEGIYVYNVFSGIDKPNVNNSTIVQPNGTYGFNNKDWIRGISTHEFGHSFVNEPLFVYKSDFNNYKYLLRPIKKKMRRQAYGNWGTVLAEHLVRMGEIRIAEKLGLKEVSAALYKDYYLGRHFIYLPHFLALIETEYEGNPQYATFADFIPRIIASLESIDSRKAKKNWKKAKRSR